MWGAAIMNGVIEEKTNRVVEVIVSSIPPSSLFAGKLLGRGGRGPHPVPGLGRCPWRLSALYGAGPRAQRRRCPRCRPCCSSSFVVLLPARLLPLRRAVRRGRRRGEHAAGGPEPGLPGDDAARARRRVLPARCCGSPDSPLSVVLSLIPFFTPLLMFLRITVADAAAVADRALRRADAGDDRARHWAGRAHLPRGHPDVRQAADLPRDRCAGCGTPELIRADRASRPSDSSPRIAGSRTTPGRDPPAAPSASRATSSPTSGPSRMPLRKRPARVEETGARAPGPTMGRPSGVPGRSPAQSPRSRTSASAGRDLERDVQDGAHAARGDALVEARALGGAAGQQAAVRARHEVAAGRAHHVAQQRRGARSKATIWPRTGSTGGGCGSPASRPPRRPSR